MVCNFFALGTPTAAALTKACRVAGTRIMMVQTVPSGLVEAKIVVKSSKVVNIAIGTAALVTDLVSGAATQVRGSMLLVIAAISLVVGATFLAMSLVIAATSLVVGATSTADHIVGVTA